MLKLKDPELFRQQAYIAGAWVNADDGGTVAVTNPANGKELGTVPMHNISPRLSATPGTFRIPAPDLGQHTDEILREVGYSPDDIAEMRNEKAIG